MPDSVSTQAVEIPRHPRHCFEGKHNCLNFVFDIVSIYENMIVHIGCLASMRKLVPERRGHHSPGPLTAEPLTLLPGTRTGP